VRIPRTREQWAALGYIAGWRVVGKLPEKWVLAAARKAADRFSGDGRGPRQLRRNLARVVGCAPEDVPDRLVRESMRSYLRYWVEAFRLPAEVGPELARRVGEDIDGLRLALDAYDEGNGIILVVTHSGNWDMAGMWVVENIDQFTTVAERLKPEELYDAFVEFRETLGFEILPLTGGEPPMVRLRERLRGGGIIALLGDRDFGGHGVEVDFFGEKTIMPVGAAQLAKETGAALMFAGLSFRPGGWNMKVYPRVPVEGRPVGDVVQDLATYMQTDIALHPADWHMLQPLWPADKKKGR